MPSTSSAPARSFQDKNGAGRGQLLNAIRDYQQRSGRDEIAGIFADFVRDHPNCADRELLIGHLTASACVLDSERRHMLLIDHRKLSRWLQPGGHADGELDLLSVAIREVAEETAITAHPLSEKIFDLDRHRIPARRQEPEHWHYDVRFLLQADPGAVPEGNHETHGARWVPIVDVKTMRTDPSVQRLAIQAAAFDDQERHHATV